MCRCSILAVLSMLGGAALVHAGDEPATKPNFVFIMADDKY